MCKKIRFTIIWILALAMVFSFAGCSGGGDDPEEKVSTSTAKPVPEDLAGNITISAYKNYENDNDLFLYVQQFTLQYPSVDVNVDAELSYDEYFATLDERIAKGKTGDVVLISSDKLAEYVEKGWIRDLSSDANGVIDYTSNSSKKLYPANVYMQAAYNASLYDGRLYMCPVEYLNQVVILNLDLLKKAGIENPVPSDQWTWDDLIAYAEQLSQSGVKTPVLMNYTDYAVWGAFAKGYGGNLYNEISFAGKTTELNFTDPDVIDGLKYLADNFLRTGYAANKATSEVSAEELSQYGIIVADHSDLIRWQDTLKRDADNGGFDWEFAHFPGFKMEDGTVYKNIGVKTLGFAVINHEVIDAMNESDIDVDKTEEELQEEKEALANTVKNAKTLALYAMVKDAAVSYCGELGYKVPALQSANTMKFWREFPVSGKNTSVFSLYSQFDYPAILTSFMSWNASKEIRDSVAEIFEAYAQNPNMVYIDDLIQEIQDAANAS
ncbi:MAG: ABC transporter substrate-binding protein [Clostridia bacterium]